MDFVNALSVNGERVPVEDERTKGNYFWEHVSSDAVAQLLLNFETHPWHLSFNGRALSEFIENHEWSDGWDVVLINNGEGRPYPGGIKCGDELLSIDSTEKRQVTADAKLISVSKTKVRVGAGGCTRIGLTQDEIIEAREDFRELHPGKKNVPDSAYLIKYRSPILMLHVIDVDMSEAQNKDIPTFLFALGVGFPKTDRGNETANYMVNLVELSNWMDPDEEEDE